MAREARRSRGCGSPCVPQPVDQSDGQASAGAIAADHDMIGGDAGLAQKIPCRQGVIQRGGEWMLGREPILDRERSRFGGPAGFGDQPAMAEDGAGAIAAAVKIQQDARSIAAGRNRPLAPQSRNIRRLRT